MLHGVGMAAMLLGSPLIAVCAPDSRGRMDGSGTPLRPRPSLPAGHKVSLLG